MTEIDVRTNQHLDTSLANSCAKLPAYMCTVQNDICMGPVYKQNLLSITSYNNSYTCHLFKSWHLTWLRANFVIKM